MDFGIAKVLEGIHGTNTQSIGTLQYMSPEQIDARTIDARSDLYSLGLIFYEMIAGDPPFQSPSPRELLNLQCTADPPALDEEVRKGLPRGVEELLFAMLEKNADDRPANAREVTEKLGMFRAAVGPAPGRAARTGGASRVSRPSREPAPATPRMANAPSRPSGASGDTMHSGGSGGSAAPPIAADADKKKADPPPKPRTDTIALVEKNASKPREVPTWLAIVAIVALSLVAGMTTYLVRLRASAPSADATPTSTSTSTASNDKSTSARP
jgi:serine/threonine-protein kinase